MITLKLSTWHAFNKAPITNCLSFHSEKQSRSGDLQAVNQKKNKPDSHDCCTFDARAQPLASSLHFLLTLGFITHTVSFSNLSEATLHTPTTNEVAVSPYSIPANALLQLASLSVVLSTSWLFSPLKLFLTCLWLMALHGLGRKTPTYPAASSAAENH